MTLSDERQLSPREREIVGLLAEGCSSNADIAERLCLSPHTVHWAMGEIRRKLGCSDRVQVLAAYRKQRPSSAWSVFLALVEPS